MRIRPVLVLPLLLIALVCAEAHADAVVLKNGSTMTGTIVKETESAVVIAVGGMGQMTVERGRIREIRRDGDAPSPTPRTPPRRPTPRRPARPPAAAPAPTAPKPETVRETAPPAPEGKAHGILLAYIDGLPARDEVATEAIWSALKQLKPLGKSATADLTHALRWSKDWRVRLLAVRALKPLGDASAAPELVHALGDPWQGGIELGAGGFQYDRGFRVRNAAADALVAIGPKAHEVLKTVAENPRHPDQVQAVRGLAKLGVPERSDLLIRIAKDRSQRTEVRKNATAGLAHQAEAQLALVSLLSDTHVHDEAEHALKVSRDRKVLEPLTGLVRRAAYDAATAKRAARCIRAVDARWKPSETSDAVDYLLLAGQGGRICRELSTRALGRLRYWQSSGDAAMKELATRALGYYKSKSG